MLNFTSLPFSIRDSGSAFISQYDGPSVFSSTSGSTLASDFGVVGTSTETLASRGPFCAAFVSSFGVVAFLDFFPVLRPLGEIVSVTGLRPLGEAVFVGDLVIEPFMEVFDAFLVVLDGVLGELLELLSLLGALAAAIERRLGRDEVAVLLTFGFLVPVSDVRRPLFAEGAVVSATASALRFDGAIAKLLRGLFSFRVCQNKFESKSFWRL